MMAQAQTAQFVFIDNAGRKIVIHGVLPWIQPEAVAKVFK